MNINKISWEKVGSVTQPGRYKYKFGWLTITAQDLDIRKKFPSATFTLVAQPPTEASVGDEEYRLGCFDISPDA